MKEFLTYNYDINAILEHCNKFYFNNLNKQKEYLQWIIEKFDKKIQELNEIIFKTDQKNKEKTDEIKEYQFEEIKEKEQRDYLFHYLKFIKKKIREIDGLIKAGKKYNPYEDIDLIGLAKAISINNNKKLNIEKKEGKIKENLFDKIHWIGTQLQFVRTLEFLIKYDLIHIDESKKYKIFGEHFKDKDGKPFNPKSLSAVAKTHSYKETIIEEGFNDINKLKSNE